jgi:hypothetical protein
MARGQIVKNNFNAGEWSPLMEGRADLEKYSSSCQSLYNMVSLPQGGATRRSGFKYIADVKTAAKKVRLIPFKATDDSNYMLEFGHLYIRVFKDQAAVGAPIEVTTTYDETDLYELKFAQSADTMTIVHEDYAIKELVRISNAVWALRTKTFTIEPTAETAGYLGSTLNASATLTPAATSGDNVLFTTGAAIMQTGDVGRTVTMVDSVLGTTYSGITVKITSVLDDNEFYGNITGTFPSTSAIAATGWRLTGTPGGSITPSDQLGIGSPCTITLTTGPASRTNLLSSGDDFWTVNGGATAYYVNNGDGTPPAAKPTAFYVDGVKWPEWPNATVPPWGKWLYDDLDTLGFDTVYINDALGDPDGWGEADSYIQYAGTTTDESSFRSNDVGKYIYLHSGAVKITAYVSESVVTGTIVRSLTAVTETAAWTLEDSLFDNADGAGNENPAAVAYYEDRLWFAGTPSNPQSVFGSVTGVYNSFFKGTDADDAIIETILSRTLTKIKWLEPSESLFIGTTGGVWRMNGGSLDAAITPTSKTVKQVTQQPSSQEQCVAVGSNLIYAHEQGQKLYSITQQTELTGNLAIEESIRADHIAVGGVTQFALQSDPYDITWMVRGDGLIIGMTFNRNQDIVAFHRHETDGTVESLAVINGATYDELWVAVNRTINGSTVRYIEVMQQFFEKTYPSDTTGAFFVDAGETVSQASSTTVTGLTHLIGETVQVMVNGKRHRDLTVSATGTLTLDYAGTSITAGLAYTWHVETQNLEAAGPPSTTQGIKQRVSNIGVMLNNTAAAQAGPSTDELKPLEFRIASVGLSTAQPLFSGIKHIANPGGYEEQTAMVLYGDTPLPATVLMVIATLDIGDP